MGIEVSDRKRHLAEQFDVIGGQLRYACQAIDEFVGDETRLHRSFCFLLRVGVDNSAGDASGRFGAEANHSF
jgi:hypothetical protein